MNNFNLYLALILGLALISAVFVNANSQELQQEIPKYVVIKMTMPDGEVFEGTDGMAEYRNRLKAGEFLKFGLPPERLD